jgi:hypothetical protein
VARRNIVLAVVGDSHCGSTLGLCPGEGVRLPDTGRYLPSPGQAWTWEAWLDFWARVRKEAKAHKAQILGLHLGDSVEGDHHGTTQLITADPEAQAYILTHALKPMRETCSKIYMCRGTPTHTGEGGDDATGRWLGAERHPDTESFAAYQWDLVVNGVRIQARHHAPAGSLPWTRHGAASRLATQIFHEATEYCVRKGVPLSYPRLAVRGHQHRFADSGSAQPTRVIMAPAWQLATSFVHKIGQTPLADVGGIIVTIAPDGEYDVMPVLYTPDAPKAVTV